MVAVDGNIRHRLQAALVVIADVNGPARLVLVGGLRRNDIDDAGGSVAAIERTLWPAQHLNVLDVEKFLLEEMVADERDVVEGDGDGRIGRH